MKRLAARTSEQHAKLVESISSENLIVTGITGNSKVNNSINQVMIIIVMLSVAMAPEPNKVIDTMQNNSKKNSVSNGIVTISEPKQVKAIEGDSGK